MKLITIQPEAFIDNLWAVLSTPPGMPVEGKKLPYPFHVKEDGEVDDQEFWKGDPKRVVGFQINDEIQKVDLWWKDAVQDPERIVGMYPVMVGPDGIYTYTVAIGSVEVVEVPA